MNSWNIPIKERKLWENHHRTLFKNTHGIKSNIKFLIYLIDNDKQNTYYKNFSYNIFDYLTFENLDYRYFLNFEDAWNSLNFFNNEYDNLSSNFSDESHGYLQGYNDEKYSLNLKEVDFVVFIPLGCLLDIQNFLRRFSEQEQNELNYRIIGDKKSKFFIYNLKSNNSKKRPWNNFESSISRKKSIREPIILNSDIVPFWNLVHFLSETQMIYNVATEPLFSFDLSHVEHLITPANGLQALAIIDKCKNLKTVRFVDIQQRAIEFTKLLISDFNPEKQKYSDFCNIFKSLNNSIELIENDEDIMNEYALDFFNKTMKWDNLKNKIRKLSHVNYSLSSLTNYNLLKKYTQTTKNILIYFSNIFHYVDTSYFYSQIDYNVLLKKIVFDQQQFKKNNSYFYGELSLSRKYGTGSYLISMNDIDTNLDKDFNFEWRKDYYEHSKNSLKLLCV
tara:strand:- start:2845 stop:4188 length:1344 start_codon:yes stop_codon:yes gene_type:complete